MKLQIPESLRPHLQGPDSEGVITVRNPTAWFNRTFAKIGPLKLVRTGGKSYSTVIISTKEEKRDKKETIVMVVDAPSPEPEEDFWQEGQPMLARLSFVEAGFRVSTSFHVKIGKMLEIDDLAALELVDIENVRVGLSAHYISLSTRGGTEMGMMWRNTWQELIPTKMCLTRVSFRAKLAGDIGAEGYIPQKASIKLVKRGPEIPIQFKAERKGVGEYEAVIEKVDVGGLNRIALFIEQHWRRQAEKLRLGRARYKKPSHDEQVGESPTKEDVMADMFKPHFLLLSDDELWRERLAEIGVVNAYEALDPEKINTILENERCDLIIADADLWDIEALNLSQSLRSHFKFRDFPLFWVAGPDNVFTSGGGLDLIDLGAFDFFDRVIEDEDLMTRVEWATKGKQLGEGESAIILSPDKRLRYRLGIMLRAEGVRVLPFASFDNPGAFLTRNKARWILLDSVGHGRSYDSMLRRILAWKKNQKEDVEVDIFLLAQIIQPEEAMNWMKAGVSDIIILDPSLRDTAEQLNAAIRG